MRSGLSVFLVPACLFMTAAFLLPLVLVVYTSIGFPEPTTAHYAELVSRPLYVNVLWNTLQISAASTLATILLAYPIAYHLARQPPRRRALLLILVLLPFWTSILVKSFAFTVLLGNSGTLNTVLTTLFGDGARIKLLFNRPAVLIGMTHYLAPFAVFSILASLLTQDPALRRAAEIMGAGRLRIFLTITLPAQPPRRARRRPPCDDPVHGHVRDPRPARRPQRRDDLQPRRLPRPRHPRLERRLRARRLPDGRNRAC